MSTFLLTALSGITLLTVSTLVFVVAKKFRFPYTVALVAFGMFLAWLAQLEIFSFIDDFRLTPDMLLYVFLPILLFESAYNIPYRDFLRNIRSISALAIVSLVVSAWLIAFLLKFALSLVGIDIPLEVSFLFGALISATDPVAVLALFKELGAPKRLTLIFEGESLFNDGTALALFLVALAAVMAAAGIDSSHANLLMHGLEWLHLPTLVSGGIAFLSMIFAGIVFGGILWLVFSHFIGKLKNEEFLELWLTLALAHTTFIASEIVNHFILPVSWVIATTIAAMVVGNYGRYKISPRVEKTMGHYWEFFAFIANSLVFLLIGIMVVELEIDWTQLALPVVLSVLVVMVSRAISVYWVIYPLNKIWGEAEIPNSWQHLLSWWSLRGALAIIMVLLIPADLKLPGWTLEMSVQDFVLALTVGCIVFTTFVKATTIFPIMKKLGIMEFALDEEAEYLKGKLRMLLDAASKLERMAGEGRIPEDEIELFRKKYQVDLSDVEHRLARLLKSDPAKWDAILYQTVVRHALWLERYWIKELFEDGEITERVLKCLLRKIESQSLRIQEGRPQLRSENERKDTNVLEKLADWIDRISIDSDTVLIDEYLKARARNIVSSRVLLDLDDLEKVAFLKGGRILETIRSQYELFASQAEERREALYVQHKKLLFPIDSDVSHRALSKSKMAVLDSLVRKGTLSSKVSAMLREEIESESIVLGS